MEQLISSWWKWISVSVQTLCSSKMWWAKLTILGSIIKTERKASTSFLQRKLQIGYNRAARIIDIMEEKGIVSKANHVGKREVL